jgi:hypothetical protein
MIREREFSRDEPSSFCGRNPYHQCGQSFGAWRASQRSFCALKRVDCDPTLDYNAREKCRVRNGALGWAAEGSDIKEADRLHDKKKWQQRFVFNPTASKKIQDRKEPDEIFVWNKNTN